MIHDFRPSTKKRHRVGALLLRKHLGLIDTRRQITNARINVQITNTAKKILKDGTHAVTFFAIII